MPGFYVSIWQGVWAPKGTPKEIIVKLNAAIAGALADPAVQKRLAEIGQEMPSAEQMTPAGFGAFHKAEMDKWTPIIKAANIKPKAPSRFGTRAAAGDRRPARHHHRSGVRRAVRREVGKRAHLCGHREAAACVRTRHPDRRRSGPARLPRSIWQGVWAPKGTPKEIIAKLNAAIAGALADPAVQKRLAEIGQEMPSAEQMTPAGFGAFHKAEMDKWTPIIKAANIKPEGT